MYAGYHGLRSDSGLLEQPTREENISLERASSEIEAAIIRGGGEMSSRLASRAQRLR